MSGKRRSADESWEAFCLDHLSGRLFECAGGKKSCHQNLSLMDNNMAMVRGTNSIAAQHDFIWPFRSEYEFDSPLTSF